MGLGRFNNDRFELVVVADHPMADTENAQWRRSFAKASELLWDASEGKLQIGKIYVCDDSVGLDTAEVVLHSSGDRSSGTWGKFGQRGQAMHLMPYVRFEVLTHIHEMGHHVWELGEEYARTAVVGDIDTSTSPPDNSTIPLKNSPHAAGELVGGDAILTFGKVMETRSITANTTTSVTVASAYSQSPVNADNARVVYQFAAECASGADTNYCVMEHSRSAAGTLDADGAWTPAAHPVTEFCVDSNHDPDADTDQQSRHGDSCWDTIVKRPGYTHLTAPDPAAAGPSSGSTTPEWIIMEKQLRFSVVIDRSGSMSTGHKMADAQHGAVYWLEFCSADDDFLSIVGYDDVVDTILAQTEVSTLGGLGAQIAAINALTPRGETNIRDALNHAREEITSRPNRSAGQAILLLTDGVHNKPLGSSPTEALDALIDAGIRVYALGVGGDNAVDMTPLNELATGTRGCSYVVGDNQGSVIENKMVEINAEVRGGIIKTLAVGFPDSKREDIDAVVGRRREPVAPASRPPLGQVLDAIGMTVDDLPALYPDAPPRSSRVIAIPVDVEELADRASFAVTHPDTDDVWLYLIDLQGTVVKSEGPRSAVACHRAVATRADRTHGRRRDHVAERHTTHPRTRRRASHRRWRRPLFSPVHTR